MMESLLPFSSPSLSLPKHPSNYSLPFLKPSLSATPKQPTFTTPFPSKPPKSSQFKASSSTISTISSNPTAPCVETDESSHKFDWFSNWYPIAPVCDLDKRVPHAKTVMGLDIVIWWDRLEKRWQVFDDRCPHRLAPLSEGRIDQWGRLQCVYHGWCFDGSGECKFIPQAPPDGPPVNTFKKACAAVYPSCEQNKIVWFWPSTEHQYRDILMKKKPPYIPELDDPLYTCLFGNRDIPYGYEVLIENLMDPAHVPYAHYGIMRVPSKNKRPKVDREGGRPLELEIKKLDATGFLADHEWGFSKFVAPCVYYAFPKSEPADASTSPDNIEGGQSSTAIKGQKRPLLVFICIPVGPGKSRLIWTFPRNFAVWLDRIVPRWMFHIGQNLILDSDLYLLHVEERKIAAVGTSNWQKACFVPTKSDALVVGFRKWLKKYAGNQVNWESRYNGALSALPPTPPREQLMDRYWSHVVNCESCRVAVKGLKVLEVCLQVISFAMVGIVAASGQNLMSAAVRSAMVFMAFVLFLSSKWLSHFIYKNFYYHDYNHALK